MRTNLSDSFRQVPVPFQGKPRIVAPNTFAYTNAEGNEVIRLHLTDIIEKLPGDRVKVSSGGWKTMTTKARLNAFMPNGYRVWSGRGTWEVHHNGDKVPFVDGMTLPDAFTGNERAVAERVGASDAKLKEQIKAFVLKSLPSNKPIPQPSNGDCWYCLMFDKEEPVGDQKYLGNDSEKPARVRNSDHLLQHIKEGYMTGSLVVNAMRDAGFKDVGISLICYSSRPDYNRVRRVVRRYLQKRLGLTY